MVNMTMMSLLTRTLILLLILTGQTAFALPNPLPDWQTIRNHQPPGMQLKLSFPKTHFFLGEEIPATLIFPYDRTSYRNGYKFYGFDDKNKPLIDSMWDWYINFDIWLYKHQYGSYQEPSPNSSITSLNQLYPFNHTGTYIIFATTDSPFGKAPAALVSDKVTITIDPRTVDEEQAVLDEARAVFAKSNASSQNGVLEECNKLWFLNTPAALKELAPFLEEGCDQQGCAAAFAFGTPPDHKEMAALLLDCVKHGKPLLNQFVVQLYAALLGHTDGPLLTNPDGTLLYKDELSIAEKEIVDAALDASGGEGPIAASAYWTTLQLQPTNSRIVTEVAAYQMDLSLNDRRELISLWSAQLRTPMGFFQSDTVYPSIQVPGSKETVMKELPFPIITIQSDKRLYNDLIPAVKMTADAPEYDPQALELLSKVAPDQARPMVIADLKRDTSLYYSKPNIHYPNPIGDDALPDQPIPELTETFRQKLHKPYKDDYLLTLVNRYGTPDLLPDVEEYHNKNVSEQTYINCADEIAYRSFMIRCNPQAGLASLEKEMVLRKKARYNDWILQVFEDRWDDADLPLLKRRLEQETYPPALIRVIKLLADHSDSSSAEPVVCALEGLSKQKGAPIEYEPSADTEKYDETQLVLSLKKRGHWDFTTGQRERLEALIAPN